MVSDRHFSAIDQLWWKVAISMTNGSGLENCSLSKPKSSLVAGSQRPETWHTPLRRPTNTGSASEELGSGQCLLYSRGGCILCTKKPLAPLPPTAEAVPDLESIPINGCSCRDPSPNSLPLVPSCCCHRNRWRGAGKRRDDNKNLGGFRTFSV